MRTVFVATWTFGEPCVRAAWEHWAEHHDLMGAIEHGLTQIELDPTVKSVGYGGMPNAEGVVELDAGVMEGREMRSGTVGALQGIVPAISVARRVLEETPHVMLAGENAQKFAIEHGFRPRQLLTKESIERYESWREEQTKAMTAHDTHDTHDTCTLVGVHEGHAIAGCTTSGLAWKVPGRVGDSPVLGAGIYADDEVGGAGATGLGEDIWTYLLSFRAIEGMRNGLSPMGACEAAVRAMVLRRPSTAQRTTAVFAVSKTGEWGAAASKDGFIAQVVIDGEFSSNPIRGLEL
jgi:isoaspartyl peptidase/L-asparaginase-like protein (Ntn-hydrolase superfamily)